jgi:hypothetical protein
MKQKEVKREEINKSLEKERSRSPIPKTDGTKAPMPFKGEPR